MQILGYFLMYFTLLLASAFAILGWYLSTRSEKKEMPDGTVVYTGNIFKGWCRYWSEELPDKIRYRYEGPALEVFMFHVKHYLSGVKDAAGQPLEMDKFSNFSFAVANAFEDRKAIIEKEMGVKLEIEPAHINGEKPYPVIVMVYKEEPNYRFPEWVRKPLATCITCHPSIYGTIVFVAFHMLCSSTYLHDMYGFAPPALYGVAVLGTYFAFVLSLSYILTFLYKKL